MHNYMLPLGLVLSVLSFLPVIFFRDKVKGFVAVFSLVSLFHVLIALTTQYIHVFMYKAVMWAYVTALVVTLGVVYQKFIKTRRVGKNTLESKESISKKATRAINLYWLPLAMAMIIFFQFFSVHYNYTGKVATAKGTVEVSKKYFPYPYYSDEWVGVSLASYSIESHSLPAVNPLRENKRFPNFLMPFFSFTSEMFLFFGINPLTGYPVAALLSGLMICFLVYMILRKNGVSTLAAVLSTMLVTYIVNGANLPGLWYFIPFHAGIIFFLIAILMVSSDEEGRYRGFSLLAAVMSIVFYPPIIVFVVPAIVAFVLTSKKTTFSLKRVAAIFSLIVAAGLVTTVVLNLAGNFPFTRVWSIFANYIIRPNLTQGAIPDLYIWRVLPMIVIPFSVHGFVIAYKKKKWLLAPLALGLLMWLLYPAFHAVVLIDYSRVVLMTSILFVAISAFSFDYLLGKLKPKILTVIPAFICIGVFFALSFSYTANDNWNALKLRVISPGSDISVSKTTTYDPSSPVNSYLNQDDLDLFSGIKGARFISSSWKGLVIGVATGNYPLESKSSTITNKILSYSDFLKADCTKKTALAKKYKIKYAYGDQFSCVGFEKIGQSREGEVLYKLI